MNKDEALRLAHEGVEIHSPNAPEYKVCAALIAALEANDEPVAWRTYIGRGYYIIDKTLEEAKRNWPDKPHTPLYTTPPQRTWVGLTDEEVTWLCNTAKSHEQTWGMFVRAIEAKLKDKNK